MLSHTNEWHIYVSNKGNAKIVTINQSFNCAEGVKAIQRKRAKAECAVVKNWGHRFIELTQLRTTCIVEMCPTAWEAVSKVFLISTYHIRKLQLLLVFVLFLQLCCWSLICIMKEPESEHNFSGHLYKHAAPPCFFVGRLYHYSEIQKGCKE